MNNIEQMRCEAERMEREANISDAINQAKQLEKIACDQDICDVKKTIVSTGVRVGLGVLLTATTGISL